MRTLLTLCLLLLPGALLAQNAAHPAPPLGRYSVHPTCNGERLEQWSTLELLSATHYRSYEEDEGEYRFDPATGRLHFLSGPEAGTTGRYHPRPRSEEPATLELDARQPSHPGEHVPPQRRSPLVAVHRPSPEG